MGRELRYRPLAETKLEDCSRFGMRARGSDWEQWIVMIVSLLLMLEVFLRNLLSDTEKTGQGRAWSIQRRLQMYRDVKFM